MEKLELLKRALPNYLNHKLKCEVTDKGVKTIAELSGIYINGECVFHDLIESEKGFEEIKSILRPLSDFTDWHSISKILQISQMEAKLFYGHLKNIEQQSYGCETLKYHFFEKLLKNHFDVFGLIEKGLAIDINTLEK